LAKFSMHLKGGRPVTGDALMSIIAPHVKRAGLVVQGGVMEASPVKQGHLRRGWATGEPEKAGRVVRVKVGNSVVYARYQNTRTRNRGYVERGVKATIQRATDTLRDGIRGDMDKLWDKGAK
jgi:hypothetical protein